MEWLRARSSRQEFERFVTDRSGSLLRTAYLMAGNLAEAEDLVQETLLRVARHWPQVRAMEHPAAYARRVLVNVALDGAERRARRAGEAQAADPVLGGVRGGEHDDHDRLVGLGDRPAKRVAVQAGKVAVKDDDVVGAGVNLGRGVAVCEATSTANP